MALSDNIKEARTKRGLTQDELAKILNKTKNVISNWERGDNKPDADTLFTLCDILGVDPNYLLSWENPIEFNMSLSEQEHIKKYRKLDEYGKKAVDTTLQNEFARCSSMGNDHYFNDYAAARDYIETQPMFAYGGINLDKMDEETLIDQANKYYALEQDSKKYLD